MAEILSGAPNHEELIEFLIPVIGKSNSHQLLCNYSSLHRIAQSTDAELLATVPKMTQVQVNRLRSSFRLGAAFAQEKLPTYTTILDAWTIADTVRWRYRFAKNEQMYVLNLDAARHLMSVDLVAVGSRDVVSATVKDIFSKAVATEASSIVITHNHPAGNHYPSQGDIDSTKTFIEAGRLLGVCVVDHVIMGSPSERWPKDYSSIKDLGLAEFDDGGTKKIAPPQP